MNGAGSGLSTGSGPYDVVGASEGPDIGSLAPDGQSFVLRALANHFDRITAALKDNNAPLEQVQFEVDASVIPGGGLTYHLPSGAAVVGYYLENNSANIVSIYAGTSGASRAFANVPANTFKASPIPQQITSVSIVSSGTAVGLVRLLISSASLGPMFGALSAAGVASAVSVSNFPATQPVSGSVAVTNFPATQPVSGSVAVTNFPATQPVSATALPLPAGASTSALQLTTAKGTQPALAVPTQDLKDSGRVSVCIGNAGLTAATTTEAFLTTLLIAKAGNALLTGQSSYTVTTGKTLRIQTIVATLVSGGSGTFGSVFTLNLRGNASGAVALTSNVLLPGVLTTTAGSSTQNVAIPIPDGLEIAGGTSIGITQQCGSATTYLQLNIVGYEY